MKIPFDLFLSAVRERKVYYFTTPKITTGVPHYFICIKKTDESLLVFTCCTSQFESRRRFIESRNLPNETLVYIKPNEDSSPFTKETFVDCNNCFIYTANEFKKMYDSSIIQYSGEISDIYYEQIIIGLRASPLIEEEIKAILPSEDDFLTV
ncbi:hypothetical protein [Chitinophaga japonensis]|uniref:Uncharacterized protein n=1 Tax=Chitinophaga japonensis TaxID=104662 RepID=A0A562THG6_CHIJA|nr:hypothetical protein [Chitinophaga japonensis]TWI92376.1 hypothetical protein LX66_1763 [Chitinophaga japonensis]